MYLSLCAAAIEERDDVRMVKVSQNFDFGFEVVLKLFAELRNVDGLDRDQSSFLLYKSN